jgi:hypothetical protein
VSDGWLVSGLRLDGQDVMGTGIVAKPGREHLLEIIITNASGALAGIVLDAQNEPVSAARVVLLPEPALRANPMLQFTTVANGKGEFGIESMLPGNYTLIALPDKDEFTPTFVRDPRNLQQYQRFGQQVRIEAGLTGRVTLLVAPE